MRYEKQKNAHVFTNEVLFIALCDLLAEKPLDKITIKELTNKAGVSRSTFYRNYNSPDDVVLDYFLTHPFGVFRKDDLSPENFEYRKIIRMCLINIQKYHRVWLYFLDSNQDLMFRVFETALRSVPDIRDRTFELGFRTDYELSAYAGLFSGICYKWLREGMKESIDEMVDISYRILHRYYINDEYAVPSRDNVYLPAPQVTK